MPSSHLILCRPLLLLPSIFPSMRVFSSESVLHIRWPKFWSVSIGTVLPMNIPGLISFRMDWMDLLAVQGTLKSLLQDQSLKTSILRHSAFFVAQLSHPCERAFRSVVSDSLRPHETQHTRSPCPSPTPGVQSNSHPSSR